MKAVLTDGKSINIPQLSRSTNTCKVKVAIELKKWKSKSSEMYLKYKRRRIDISYYEAS